MGAAVLNEMLGDDFSGIIGSDYYGAYRSFPERRAVAAQYCRAHRKRGICFLTESPDWATVNFGKRVEDARKKFSRAWGQKTRSQSRLTRLWP